MRGLSSVSAWMWLAVAVTLASVAGACSSRSASSPWSVQGPIQAIDGRVWIVGNRLVTIAPDARIIGAPAIGSVAQVRGTRNERGSPIGESVEITSSPQATPPPTATTAPPPTAPPQAPVIAPAPAPTAKPAIQPKPQAEPDRDEDEDDDKKEKKERRGPPAKPGHAGNREEKPRGR